MSEPQTEQDLGQGDGRSLAYDVVDVFTDRPFAGNQLAVVHGAEDLTAAQCRSLAQEFAYSETTFPVPTGSDTYSTRIFTPGGEIPFAGHPTLGTAWVLRAAGRLRGPRAVQRCGAGDIEVRFTDADLVELAAAPRDLLGPLEDAWVASLLEDVGLSSHDLAGPAWIAGTGLDFVHLPVHESALGRARPSFRPLHAYDAELHALGTPVDPLEGINLHHVAGTAPDLSVRSRVFVPGLDVPEDPATGSAAAGLGVALVASGALPEGGRYTISQGVEMGRPSRLLGRVEAADGRASRCLVAGGVRRVASGRVVVPPGGTASVS